MKRALVCGAGGFVGGHLVKKLKQEGYWVRGVDIRGHKSAKSQADDFQLLDLREAHNCRAALSLDSGEGFDEAYQLAADMGGIGFIHAAECDIMHNSALINIHMIDAATRAGVGRYFFSSSVCVYRDMAPGEPALDEEGAYPALPGNEYGWEKLYAERTALAYARHHPIEVRIARFQNCYGPEGTWRGGREKAPAAICRKVVIAEDGGTIPVWGDGSAIRAYTYVGDLVDGVFKLMQSSLQGPVNIGSDEYVTVDELVETVVSVSGKKINVEHVEGPVGVQARNFDKARIKSLGWKARTRLREGIARTYAWIEEQVRMKAATEGSTNP
jgi:GDP-D-mannose 3',5'-epimerase